MGTRRTGQRKTDHELLAAYDDHLNNIRCSTVVHKGIDRAGNLSWSADDKILRTTTRVDENAFYAFCVLFRPLWLQRSPQNFNRIVNTLNRGLLTDPEKQHLDKCSAHWNRNLRVADILIGVSTDGGATQRRMPADWINDILGETHHPGDDEARQEIIKNVKDVLGPQGWMFIQLNVLPSMIELTKAAIALHELVKSVLKRSSH